MSIVAHETKFTQTSGTGPASQNPSAPGFYFYADTIQIPTNHRHHRFIVAFHSAIPANEVWLKLCPTNLNNPIQAFSTAGSITTGGVAGRPRITASDTDILLTKGDVGNAIGNWRWSFLKEPGEDSGTTPIDQVIGFGAYTQLQPAYENPQLKRPVVFECTARLGAAMLFWSETGNGGLHSWSWYLACQSSTLPFNMLHENHYQSIL